MKFLGILTCAILHVSCIQNKEHIDEPCLTGLFMRDDWFLSVVSCWNEYDLIPSNNKRIRLPDIVLGGKVEGTIIIDLLGEIEGNYVAYYGNGPFKSVIAARIPYQNGNISGIASYWNEHGKLVRQERWNSGSLVEERLSAPWLSTEGNQTPADGLYTMLGDNIVVVGHPVISRVEKQWKYRSGQIVETRTAPPWEPPTSGFWKGFRGTILNMPDANGNRFFLDGQPLANGDKLMYSKDESVIVELDLEEKIPGIYFLSPDGGYINFNQGVVFNWPEN